MSKQIKNEFSEVIGLSEMDATVRLQSMGLRVRCMERNGESFMGTMEYRTGRVNIRVKDDVVISASRG